MRIADIMRADVTCENIDLASITGIDDITYDDLTFDDLNPDVCKNLLLGLMIYFLMI